MRLAFLTNKEKSIFTKNRRHSGALTNKILSLPLTSNPHLPFSLFINPFLYLVCAHPPSMPTLKEVNNPKENYKAIKLFQWIEHVFNTSVPSVSFPHSREIAPFIRIRRHDLITTGCESSCPWTRLPNPVPGWSHQCQQWMSVSRRKWSPSKHSLYSQDCFWFSKILRIPLKLGILWVS